MTKQSRPLDAQAGASGLSGGLVTPNRFGRGSSDQRKTVTFGDASAVRSKPFWSLVSLLLLIGFWWWATTPFGFDESGDFRASVDQRFDDQADDAIVRNQERIDEGRNEIVIPFRDPTMRDYLSSCEQEWGPAKDQAEEEVTAEVQAAIQNGTALPAGVTESNGRVNIPPSVLENRAIAISACDGSYNQLVNPRTMPSPGDTWTSFTRLSSRGFKGETIWGHARISLWRVIRGMFFGSVFGIPIGFAMGLSSRLRGFFDTPVEGFRPIPPLAVLPLFILWFGIGDGTAVRLLIFASIWIMIIAARAGAGTVQLSKVRAAYSLGASKWQILRRVILPNALPELFTGARVALGVCWGTLVAAELVGAETGLGSMIFDARNNLRTDVVVVGIIVIAVIGVMMDIMMRWLEARLIPWRGKG